MINLYSFIITPFAFRFLYSLIIMHFSFEYKFNKFNVFVKLRTAGWISLCVARQQCNKRYHGENIMHHCYLSMVYCKQFIVNGYWRGRESAILNFNAPSSVFRAVLAWGGVGYRGRGYTYLLRHRQRQLFYSIIITHARTEGQNT